MPPPDGAHAIGAPLRPPSGDLRSAPTAYPTRPNPGRAAATTNPPSEPPYHPHIQHAHLGVTSIYLQGIDNAEIIDAVRSRRQPTISATAGLTL